MWLAVTADLDNKITFDGPYETKEDALSYVRFQLRESITADGRVIVLGAVFEAENVELEDTK